MLNAIDEWLSSPQSAARLLAPGAKAEELHRAERALSDIRMAEVDQPQTIGLGTWAARVDRIDLDATGLTIAFRPSDLLANIDPQRLTEQCVIRWFKEPSRNLAAIANSSPSPTCRPRRLRRRN